MKNDIDNYSLIKDREFIFGSLFVIANKLQILLDKALSDYDMTAKQWFLTIALGLFEMPPTLKEVASTMGYSHQNVKQIAMKLQQKGFLSIEKDKKDARAIRLKLTEKSALFWRELQDEEKMFLSNVYKGMDEMQISVFRENIAKLLSNLDYMEHKD